jgi:hypothetical protein
MKIRRVTGAWDERFHKIIERARQQYSRQIGKEISMQDVSTIWSNPNMTQFRIPKLRRRKWI